MIPEIVGGGSTIAPIARACREGPSRGLIGEGCRWDGIDHADDLERVLLSGVSKLYFPPGEYIVRKYDTYSQNVALDNHGTEPNSTSCGGGACPGPAWDHGAVKIYLREGDVSDVLISNVAVVDPTYAGLEIRGMTTAIAKQYGIDYPGHPYPQVFTDADNAKLQNVTFQNVSVTGAGTYGIAFVDLDSGNRGSASFDGPRRRSSPGSAATTRGSDTTR